MDGDVDGLGADVEASGVVGVVALVDTLGAGGMAEVVFVVVMVRVVGSGAGAAATTEAGGAWQSRRFESQQNCLFASDQEVSQLSKPASQSYGGTVVVVVTVSFSGKGKPCTLMFCLNGAATWLLRMDHVASSQARPE